MLRDYVGELNNLKFQYNNLRMCLMKMEIRPDHFTDSKEIRELRALMNLALQTMRFRIQELEQVVPLQGKF